MLVFICTYNTLSSLFPLLPFFSSFPHGLHFYEIVASCEAYFFSFDEFSPREKEVMQWEIGLRFPSNANSTLYLKSYYFRIWIKENHCANIRSCLTSNSASGAMLDLGIVGPSQLEYHLFVSGGHWPSFPLPIFIGPGFRWWCIFYMYQKVCICWKDLRHWQLIISMCPRWVYVLPRNIFLVWSKRGNVRSCDFQGAWHVVGFYMQHRWAFLGCVITACNLSPLGVS